MYVANQEARVVASALKNDTAAAAVAKAEAKETNRIIVKFKDEGSLPPGLSVALAHANLEKAQGLTKLTDIEGINAQVYEIAEDDTPSEVVKRIAYTQQDLIEYAEVDMLVSPTLIPNDPYYGNQWHHPNVGTPSAWDKVLGENVIVAVADTGVNPHPDLQFATVPGINTVDGSADTSDVMGHGTKVSGTVAAINNNNIGVSGVAPKAVILPIRITNDPAGWAYYSDMASAITYAADHGARVVNLSYQAYKSSSAQSAASYMRSKGGIVTSSAGNDNIDEGYADVSSITIISATASNNLRTSWSSYGTMVDVSAPGASIYTTTSGGGYGAVSGTSFSAPLTAGIYALMFSVNPDLSPAQADSVLFSTADDIGDAGWDMYYGYGKVNAAKAVALAASTTGSYVVDRIPPTIPGNLRTTNVAANQVALAWNQSTDDVLVASYAVYRDGVKRATVSGTTYTDTTVSPDTTYTYTVTAMDKSDNESAQSAPVTATTPTLPFSILSDTITAKTATDATLAVSLSALGTVTVKYGTSATNLAQTVQNTTEVVDHTLTLANLAARTTYYYQVTATSNGTTVTSAVGSFKTLRDGTTSTGGGKKR